MPLPANIAAGVNDVSKRTDWNAAAPPEFALPTETWREHIARRQRCIELREKLTRDSVESINELITLNLDIRQFAQDVIDNCESADLLRSIYYTIAGRSEKIGTNQKSQLPLSVLDPTCGSGAFLFASLNILQPLYEACLTKMEQFVSDADQSQPFTVDDELAALIELGESNTLEFKSTARFDVKKSEEISHLKEGKQREILKRLDKNRQQDILKAVSAMLNAKGGDVIIGVDDKGKGLGIERDYPFFDEMKRTRDAYELWLTNDLFIASFGKIAAGLIEISFARRDGMDVCRMKVHPSPDPVFFKEGGNDVFYRRLNNSSQKLDMPDYGKYLDQRFKSDPPRRMEPKLLPSNAAKKTAKTLKDFREILGEVEKHPNRTYFVLKSIIINNLYGVDIMPEAVEICKLRLFLKLMSTVEPNYGKKNLGVEALPDIDFNIRAGNTLVGYTSPAEIKASFKERFGLFDEKEIAGIEKQVKIVSLQFELFRRQQTELDGQIKESDKAGLRNELETLTQELNEFLAGDYEVDSKKKKNFAEWKASHQPFHWFGEFYAIMSSGGFNAIIGNPPWKEYSAVKKWYTVRGYRTERCGNLHGICTERALTLKSPNGQASFIVQLPVVCSSRMVSVRSALRDKSESLTVISFDDRPGKLFDGLQHCRSAIWFSAGSSSHATHLSSTRYQRWNSEAREFLFDKLEFATGVAGTIFPELIPKYDQSLHARVFDLVKSKSSKRIADAITPSARKHFCFYQEATQYWVKAVYGLPFYAKNGEMGAPAHGRYIYCDDKKTAHVVTAILNSSLFYSYFVAYSDCFHLSQTLVERFPVTGEILNDGALAKHGEELMIDLKQNAEKKTICTKAGDEIEYAEFVAAKSKPIIDTIDVRLMEHFGLCEEQQEFILNYDIKYRMGSQND